MKTAKIVSTCVILAACLGLTACGKSVPESAFTLGQQVCAGFGGLYEVTNLGNVWFTKVKFLSVTCEDYVKIKTWYKEQNGTAYICSAKNPC